jgi:glycosyltransferase involved in cell wall biosynthesis
MPFSERRASRGARDSTRQEVLWVTNIAAPYRIPLWQQMSKCTKFEVLLLESDKQRQREGRRGSDWTASRLGAVRHRTLRCFKLRRGETSLYTLIDLRSFLLKPKALLLGGWESPAYWQFLAMARIRRLRVVGFYESTLHTNRYRSGPIARARSWYFRHLDAVVVPGIEAERALLSFGVRPDRVVRGFNAVDVGWIAARARDRRPLHGERPGHRFVFVGQLIARKQPLVVLEAFAAVRQPGDSLLFVGDGPERSELERRIKTSRLGQIVTVAGSVSNQQTIDAMIDCETLVMPSLEEVWGLVANEALAAGLHVVVTKKSGVAESIRTMDGVFTCDPDEASVATAMRASRSAWTGPITDPEILEHDPAAFADAFLKALDVS